MCGTHTKEAADHALRSPWDPQSLRHPFTMTVKENGPMFLPGPTSL